MQHLRALTKEIHEETTKVAKTPKGRRLIKLLQANLKKILLPTDVPVEEQRVETPPNVEQMERERQQRIIDDTPIITLPRITNAEPIMESRNPTSKRVLKQTPRSHRRVTRNNKPGEVAPIKRTVAETPMVQTRSKATAPYNPVPSGARQRIVTRQAINVLTMMEKALAEKVFIPRNLEQFQPTSAYTNKPQHYMNPAIHPVTGETFTSYRKAMKDQAIADVWMTAFGKEFGGLAQGDNKTKTKGTNAMFVMTHDDIDKLQ